MLAPWTDCDEWLARGDRLAGNADIIEIGEKGTLVLRWRDQLDSNLGDDRQGSFTSDQKVLKSIYTGLFKGGDLC